MKGTTEEAEIEKMCRLINKSSLPTLGPSTNFALWSKRAANKTPLAANILEVTHFEAFREFLTCRRIPKLY